MILDQDLLAILQCPRTGRPLVRLEDDCLAALGAGPAPTTRYPVRDGIPVLISDATACDAVVESFKVRSSTYYEDNYVDGGNAERQARQSIVLHHLWSQVAAGGRVLEAGAGPAVLGSELTKLTTEYVALDISLENLLEGRRRLGSLTGVVGDLTALPFRSGSFDVVVAIGCLEYVHDLPTAISELARVTAPGGAILASFANAASPRRWWDERLAHPLLRTIRIMRKRSGPRYRRWLQREFGITTRFAACDCEVERVRFYGAAFAGYPLSRSERVCRADAALASRYDLLAHLQAEFLLLVRKRT